MLYITLYQMKICTNPPSSATFQIVYQPLTFLSLQFWQVHNYLEKMSPGTFKEEKHVGLAASEGFTRVGTDARLIAGHSRADISYLPRRTA